MLRRIYKTESEIRKRQIDTLKIFNDNVIEVTAGIEYCITFQSGRNELTLLIYLSNDFPKEKPLLKITPVVVHQWVNSEGEITSAPGLLNFTVHSDLGRVVQAIIREFERTPPPLLLKQPPCRPTSPVSFCKVIDKDSAGVSSPNYAINSYATLPQFSQSPQSVNRLPSTSKAIQNQNQSILFPDLNALTLEELNMLNENEDRQCEFVENLPQLKELNKTLDDFITQIEELADANLAKKNKLDSLNTERNIRIERLTKLLNNNEVLNQNYQLLSDRYRPSNIKELLRLAAGYADEESESIAERFLNGEIDVDQFVSSYIKARSLFHIRRTKEEKLSHQLSELERAGF